MKRMNFEVTKQKSTSKNSEPERNKRENFQRNGTLACGGTKGEWKGRREGKKGREKKGFFGKEARKGRNLAVSPRPPVQKPCKRWQPRAGQPLP